MQRRDEEEKLQIRPVSISKQISSLVIGSGSRIVDAWIELDGHRVTQVPINSKFDILVHYIVNNTAWSAFDPTWRVAVTAISSEGKVRNYESTKVGVIDIGKTKEEKRMKLDQLGDNYMPAGTGPLNIRIKLWAHDNIIGTDYPPESEW